MTPSARPAAQNPGRLRGIVSAVSPRNCIHCLGLPTSTISDAFHQPHIVYLDQGTTVPTSTSALRLTDERRAYAQLQILFAKRRVYANMMATRPQTLCGLADSPVGLAAWMLDHPDGYGRPAPVIMSAALGRTINGCPADFLTCDDVLDDITLYWVTNTAISSARFYWESKFNLYNAANVSIPAGVSVFPGENYQAPRSWAERAYHKLIYFNEVEKGGHYAAWEQPELFARELRAAFRTLRRPT